MEKTEEFETCGYCGYRSRLRELFVKAYTSLKSKKIRLCPGCYAKKSEKISKDMQRLYLFVALIILAFSYFSPNAKPPWVLINLIFLFLFLRISLFLHELGHALCAKALGGFVPKIVIGSGRLLIRFNIGNTDCELRSHWSYGLTYLGFDNQIKFGALRYTFSILAGPLTNLILALTALLIMKSDYFEPNLTESANPYWVLINVNLLMFVGAIFPRSIKWLGNTETDGKQIMKYLFNKKEFLQIFQVQYYIVCLQQMAEQEKYDLGLKLCIKALDELPNDPWITNYYCYFLINLRENAKATNLLEIELRSEFIHEQSVKSKILLAFTHNNLSYALSESNQSAERMVESATYAFDSMPWIPSILQTYGVVMCLEGDFETGVRELQRALTFEQTPNSLCENHAQLGLAYCAVNKLEEADKHLEQAKIINTKSRFVLQLEGNLADSRASYNL